MKISNIFFIVADCLRHDLVNMKYSNHLLMPTLSKFIKNSIYFPNSFTNATTTHYALPALLTGLFPDTKKGWGINSKSPYLPSVLKANSFKTVGITANIVTSRAYNYNRSFDYFQDFFKYSTAREKSITNRRKNFSESSTNSKKFIKLIYKKGRNLIKKFHKQYNMNYSLEGNIDGKEVLNEFSKQLEFNKEKKTFYFLHFMDNHAPYAPPKSFIKRFLPNLKVDFSELENLFKEARKSPENFLKNNEKKQIVWKLYLATVNYFDELFSEFISYLSNVNLYENSLIIVLSDHGEAFGEHGYLQHPMNHHNSEQIRTFMAIKYPGKTTSVKYNLVESIDVFPTILDLLGVYKAFGDNITSSKDINKKSILTVGSDDTYSLTTKNFRYLKNSKGRFLYNTQDILELNKLEFDETIVNTFEKKVSEMRKRLLRKNIKFLEKSGNMQNTSN